MRSLIHALEPLWWGLFVTGTFLSALLLPGILLVVAIGVPLGVGSPELLSYERMHGLVSGILGRLLVLTVVGACLWNGAHHLRHFNIDMGGHGRDTAVAALLYALAGIGSLLAVVAVLRF